jgi:hypothetical protein
MFIFQISRFMIKVRKDSPVLHGWPYLRRVDDSLEARCFKSLLYWHMSTSLIIKTTDSGISFY